MKRTVVVIAGALAVTAAADTATVIVEAGPSAETNRMELVGGRLAFAAADVAGADRLKVILDDARAKTGEPGYFVLPDNTLGTYRLTNGSYLLAEPQMAFFGMKTPRRTFITEAFGWELWHSVEVTATNGAYAVAHVFDFREERPDCAFGVTVTGLPPDADYPAMAKAYRDHRLAAGCVKPLRARFAAQPELATAATSITVRVRQAWKPSPSKVAEQNAFNEPDLCVAVTFDRACQLVRACSREGLKSAEFCLVGWNKGGHDGAYPQVWPVEPKLGGIAGMRRFIAEANALGYRVTVHNNFQDCYTIADCWDEGDICRDRAGNVRSTAGSKWVWSAGTTYLGCPQRMWERYVVKQMHALAALGCRGLHYVDVISCYRHVPCFDSRHPCSRRDGVRYYLKMFEEMRRTVGGTYSEGPHDFVASGLDACLYVSNRDPAGRKNMPEAVDRFVPLWQLVYHGIILSSPYYACMSYPADRTGESRLALVEFGGRPTLYLHCLFFNQRTMKPKGDLTVLDDEGFAESVRAIKLAADEFAPLADLQLEYMTDHRLLAPGVALTAYANGARTVVNRSDRPFAFEGVTVPARDWRRL